MFSAIKNACEQFRARPHDDFFRFYTEEFGLTGRKLEGYIPRAADLSAADYGERITRKLNGWRFGLVINQFQTLDEWLLRRARKFLHPLLVELPNQRCFELVTFVGNYDKTPFGIHKDELSIFHFVVEGRKRFYFWPSDYFTGQDDPRLHSDFETLRRDALVLEAEPGDLIFWPASFWHIGESVGGLTSTVSIGLASLHPAKDIWKLLLTKMEEAVGPLLERNVFNGLPGETPESSRLIMKLSKLAADALRKTSRDPQLAKSLRVLWLSQMTGAANGYQPPPLPWKDLPDDVLVMGQPENPIVWMPAADDDMVCSVNGHSFFIPADPNVVKMFEQLNDGKPRLVRDLIKEHAGKTKRGGVTFNSQPEGIRTVLSKLYSLRAIS